MLENEGVGARSGTSRVCGSARSQKKWKLRRSRSSRSAVVSAGIAAVFDIAGAEREIDAGGAAQASQETAQTAVRRRAAVLRAMSAIVQGRERKVGRTLRPAPSMLLKMD